MSIDFDHIRELADRLRKWESAIGPIEKYNSWEVPEDVPNEKVWAIVSFESDSLLIVPKSDMDLGEYETSDVTWWLVTAKEPTRSEWDSLICEIRFDVSPTDLVSSHEEPDEDSDEVLEAYLDIFEILDDDSDENILKNIGTYDNS